MSAPSKTRFIDALLLVMVLIWGTNYSIVKAAFREIDAQAFNAARMIVASFVFLSIIVLARRLPFRGRSRVRSAGGAASIADIFQTPAPFTGRDWAALAGLGLVGHFLYQYCFIGGLARTSVANSSLMLAATPVVIALITAALGRERISGLHWAGAALSVIGIYIIVGRSPSVEGETLAGDLMMFGAVCCWAVYTIAAQPLMARHSPVGLTGVSMALGTLIYVAVVWPSFGAVNWAGLSVATWMALVYSALFALCVAYTIWYAAVRQIGGARTSVYSNLIPLVAMLTAVLFLGESLDLSKVVGAGAVLIGVALTRVRRTPSPIPAQK